MAKPPSPAVFTLSALGAHYPVYVDEPAERAKDGEPPVLVLCLDGDDQFADMCKARRVVEKEQGLRPLLLAGIGYGAGYGKPGNRRSRDYTSVAIAEEPEGGGAEAFHDFLTGIVWPELARRHEVHPTIRGLAGYSLGALFGVHALFRPSPFFNRVLAASPSIWWGDRAVLKEVEAVQEQNLALPARLFLSVGLKDSRSMKADLDLLEQKLETRPVRELHVGRARFPEHNHFNAISVSFRAGLVDLFSNDPR